MIHGALWPSLILLVLVSLPMQFEFPQDSLAKHALTRYGHSDTSSAFRIPSSWRCSITIMCQQVAAHSQYVTLERRALCRWYCGWSGHGEVMTTTAIIAADGYLVRSGRALQSVRPAQMEK
ncbi:hypothetical protein BJ912DRAFT_971245 [Pholiota molesta]|nr:hypothetical protein BJ912DRAFT_971245 [Pholiota molesta]